MQPDTDLLVGASANLQKMLGMGTAGRTSPGTSGSSDSHLNKDDFVMLVKAVDQ